MARFAAAVLCIGAVLLAPAPVRAHDAPSGWRYDKLCCGDHDCHPTPCERITSVAGGFSYHSYDNATYFFTRDKMRWSQDGECHVCVNEAAHSAQCIYLPIRTHRLTPWIRPSF